MKPFVVVLLAAFAGGDLSFHETILPAGPHASIVAAADLNHDSRPDLVGANLEDGTVTILLNDGGGRFHPAPGSPFNAGSQPNDFAVADFNHDGNPDLAVRRRSSASFSATAAAVFIPPPDLLSARNPIPTRTESWRAISPATAPST
jgi:hypothetical protein